MLKIAKKISLTRVARKDASGFTLIEILIAMTFLSVSLLAFVSLAGTTVKGNSKSRNITSASVSNVSRYENLRNLAFTDFDHADLASGVVHTDYLDINGVSVAQNDAALFFTNTWTVVDDTAPANVKTVTFNVSWSKWGTAKSLSYSTIFSR